ncbi:MAG: sugar nucleotide-binding protein, partial [Alistipes sp.]|nr:sugar nucleotide-binding protein [Alistipes sp.]
MNILVTGADGQLGRALRLVARNGKATYLFTDAAELDITDSAAVEKTMADLEPAIVVNCAAYTNVEKAEEEVERAERLNT